MSTSSKAQFSPSFSVILGLILALWTYIEFQSFMAVGLVVLFWVMLNVLILTSFLPIVGPIIFYFVGHGWVTNFILAKGIERGIDFGSFIPFDVTFWVLFVYGALLNVLLIVFLFLMLCIRRGV